MNTNQTIKTIRNALISVRRGAPIQHENLTIYPLHIPNGHAPAYVLLDTAIESEAVEITETSESGHVPELLIKNIGACPVLIPEGTIVSGGKQNRVVNISVVIEARAQSVIPVSCVEHGRWSHSHSFEPSHFAPPSIRANKTRSVLNNIRDHHTACSDQSAVWREVSDRLKTMNTQSVTECLNDAYTTAGESLNAYTSNISLPENTAGIIVCINEHVSGMDMFDSPLPFKALWNRLAESYALQAIVDRSGKPQRGFNIDSFIQDITNAVALSPLSIGSGIGITINTETLAGCGVYHNNKLCHLSAFHTEEI